MEPAKAVKEYKEQISKKEKEIEELQKQLGKSVVEKEWLAKKLKSLGLYEKKSLVEPKLKDISVTRQCELLSLNRASLYYKPIVNQTKLDIKQAIVNIHNEIPIYGYKKVYYQLLEDGYSVSANTVLKYRQELGLKPILAVKKPNFSIPNKEHTIYSYKLKDIEITHANQVWSTDITYIKIKGGMV
jgi:putative transposase